MVTRKGETSDLATITDSVGTVLTLTYGDNQHPHTPTALTDGANRTWNYTLNANGQVTEIAPPANSPQGATEITYYESQQSPYLGYVQSIANGAGDTITFDAYSDLGQVTSKTTSPSQGISNTTLLTYDAAQRLTQVEHPDNQIYSYVFDKRDLAYTTDEAGTEIDYTWCPNCGALQGIDAPLNKSLSWQQNADKQVTSFQDALTHSTTYTYGNAGEAKDYTYPDAAKWTYKYDNYGRFKSITSPRNRVHTLNYNSAGFVSSETFYTGETGNTYTYNTDGTISQVIDELGTTDYTYNGAKQVLTVTYTWTNKGLTPVQVLTYTYNPDGSVATLEWASGGTAVASWTYGYDLAGRQNSVANSFSETTSYTYDGEGKVSTQNNQNGTVTSYTYNEARNWPTRIAHALSGTDFARYDLVYDDGNNTVGNLTDVTELDSSTLAYTYDALYRLTEEVRTGTGAYSKSYTYDLAGNVTQVNGSTFATYDSANKISTLTGGSVSHDTDGNITAANGAGIPAGGVFTWHTKDRMLSQASTGQTTLYYYYDNEGIRRYKRAGTTTTLPKTHYIYDSDRLIGEIYQGTPSVAYTWGPDGLVSERLLTGTPKSLWYHFGPQGETRQLTDSNGSVVDQYRYTAYGLPLYTSGTDTNAHRYGGKYGYYTDGPNGFVLAGARWYSPNLLRWISRDPISYDGGDNVYGYVTQNPVRFVDPSGLESEWMFHILDHGGPHFQRMVNGVAQRYRPTDLSPIKFMGELPPALSKTEIKALMNSKAWAKWICFSAKLTERGAVELPLLKLLGKASGPVGLAIDILAFPEETAQDDDPE